MNQQVFKRDSLVQNIRKRLVDFNEKNNMKSGDTDQVIGESDI